MNDLDDDVVTAVRHDRTNPQVGIPPEDIPSERALLGSLLMGGSTTFIQAAALVTAEDFTRMPHRDIFMAMQRIHEAGQAIDYASVAGELARGGLENPGPHLVDLIAVVPTYLHAETYARRVRYCATGRRIIEAGSRLAAVGFSIETSEGEAVLMGRAQAVIDTLLNRLTGHVQVVSSADYAKEYADVLAKREAHDRDYLGYNTGLRDLDEVARFVAGEYWIVAAAPGVGKTAILQNFQQSLADRGIPTLFASIEQPRVQLMDRAIAADSRIDSWRIARGVVGADEWPRLWQAVSHQHDLPIYVYEDAGMTTASLAAAAHLAKARFGIKVVFVDYIQIMNDVHGGDSEVARVGYISRALGRLARQLGITLVAASQLSRAYAKRAKGTLPEMTDLRETGQLEQDAFVIIGMARHPDRPDEVLLGVLKNRNGPSGITLKLRFDPQFTQFSEWEEKREEGND